LHDSTNETAVRVRKHILPDVNTTVVCLGECQEIFISAQAREGEDALTVFLRVASVLDALDATVVCQQVFGFTNRGGTGLGALHEALGEGRWPITWLEGDTEPLCAGTEVWAVSSATVVPIEVDGIAIGTVFGNGCGRVCRLGGLLPRDRDADPMAQTRAVLDTMQRGLRAADLDFADVVRTWFHNRDILSWYDNFNRVRDAFFNELGVFDRLIPASTAVAGNNAVGAALTAGLVAIRPFNPATVTGPVVSPLQCSAMDYGKSFSRAVEMRFRDHRRLFVSGTASIEPGGRTAHVGDLERQIDLTLRVVQAILESKGLAWDDVVRAIGYIKHPHDVPATRVVLANAGLDHLPLVLARNDICRDNLLFELEVDAIAAARQF